MLQLLKTTCSRTCALPQEEPFNEAHALQLEGSHLALCNWRKPTEQQEPRNQESNNNNLIFLTVPFFFFLVKREDKALHSPLVTGHTEHGGRWPDNT